MQATLPEAGAEHMCTYVLVSARAGDAGPALPTMASAPHASASAAVRDSGPRRRLVQGPFRPPSRLGYMSAPSLAMRLERC